MSGSTRLHTARWRFRRARATDRGALRAFLGRLSPGTVQARFLGPAVGLQGPLAERELERILERTATEHMVILAMDGVEVRGIGEFMIERDDHAELALVVEDAFQGLGIGRSLFRNLEQRAWTRGLRAFTGDIAYGNSRAVALLRASGQRLQMQVSYGSLRFKLLLGTQAPPCGTA